MPHHDAFDNNKVPWVLTSVPNFGLRKKRERDFFPFWSNFGTQFSHQSLVIHRRICGLFFNSFDLYFYSVSEAPKFDNLFFFWLIWFLNIFYHSSQIFIFQQFLQSLVRHPIKLAGFALSLARVQFCKTLHPGFHRRSVLRSF